MSQTDGVVVAHKARGHNDSVAGVGKVGKHLGGVHWGNDVMLPFISAVVIAKPNKTRFYRIAVGIDSTVVWITYHEDLLIAASRFDTGQFLGSG